MLFIILYKHSKKPTTKVKIWDLLIIRQFIAEFVQVLLYQQQMPLK
jgi:hypothetical protein